MYVCPRCQGDLTTTDLDGIEIEECNKCEGMWLDANELSQLIGCVEPDADESSEDTHSETGPDSDESHTQNSQSPNIEVTTNESTLTCPKCTDRNLTAFIYDGDTGIELDSCSNCHGLWLDKNELKQIEFFANMNKENEMIKATGEQLEAQRVAGMKSRLKATLHFAMNSFKHKKRRSLSPFSLFSSWD